MRTTLLAAVAITTIVAGAAEAQTLKLMTGPQGGSWYPLGGALQQVIQQNVSGANVIVLPGAGIANVKAIEAGKADIGFANSVSTVDAIGGNPPFETKAKDICNVATLYPQFFQVIALSDSHVAQPGDLAGKAAAIQPKGNTAEAITGHLLKVIGTTVDDLPRVNYGSYSDAVSLMKDGNADWFTLGTSVPAGAIMDLASARDITVVPIPDDTLAKMKELNPGYQRMVIPAGSYPGQDADVPTIGYQTHIIARCSLDADVVYNLLKGMAANVDNFAAITSSMKGMTPAEMGVDVGVPMHEGAKRFYAEAGNS